LSHPDCALIAIPLPNHLRASSSTSFLRFSNFSSQYASNFASHLWTLFRGAGLRAWIRSRPWRRTVIKSADRRIRKCLMTAGRLIVNCSAIRPAGNSFPASNSRILRRLRSAIDRNILSRLLLRRERSETIVFVSSRRHTNICRDSGPIPG
jgi:hypothetical protein